MAHNEAHNALVHEALQGLAINGYKAWENETGAWFDGKRPHKFGKKGSGDIFIILPLRVYAYDHNGCIKEITVGMHVEAEAKTGLGRQNKNQENHQKYVVEPSGGAYILFRSVPELLQKLRAINGAAISMRMQNAG